MEQSIGTTTDSFSRFLEDTSDFEVKLARGTDEKREIVVIDAHAAQCRESIGQNLLQLDNDKQLLKQTEIYVSLLELLLRRLPPDKLGPHVQWTHEALFHVAISSKSLLRSLLHLHLNSTKRLLRLQPVRRSTRVTDRDPILIMCLLLLL